jgi:hypothetical protein
VQAVVLLHLILIVPTLSFMLPLRKAIGVLPTYQCECFYWCNTHCLGVRVIHNEIPRAGTGLVNSARAAASGASAVCMSSASEKKMRVGIVGAGISGCLLARKLKDAVCGLATIATLLSDSVFFVLGSCMQKSIYTYSTLCAIEY